MLEKYFDESAGADAHGMSQALRPFGVSSEEDVSAVDRLERKCREDKATVTVNIGRESDGEIVFCATIAVFDRFVVCLSARADAFDEYIDNEFSVTLNGISKYRGANFKAAVQEAASLVDEGVSAREGYRSSIDYRRSLFRIRYLQSFKRLLGEEGVSISKIEDLLKRIKCVSAFVTDAFVRHLYSIDGSDAKFCIDMHDSGKIELRVKVDGCEHEFTSRDMCECIRRLYDLVC